MSFICAYCDKEHKVKSNIFNLGGNVCKLCANLFGIRVISVKVQTGEDSYITYKAKKDKNVNK